jgi:hypothetical protein
MARTVINFGNIWGTVVQILQFAIATIFFLELRGYGVVSYDMLLGLEIVAAGVCAPWVVCIYMTDHFTPLDNREPFWDELWIVLYSAVANLLGLWFYHDRYGIDGWDDRHREPTSFAEVSERNYFTALCFLAIGFEGWCLLLRWKSHVAHIMNHRLSQLRSSEMTKQM